MSTRRLWVKHTFGGGWATDFGVHAEVLPDQAGRATFPFLRQAQNVIYELDGGVHKAPGVDRVNSAALEAGAAIWGVFDYWVQGTAGSPSQHRIMHINDVVKKDDGDGTFTDLKTGLEADKVPSYAELKDLLVWASNSNTDVPQSWDGTTQQNLAGTPPNFAIVVEHKGRLWAAGVASAPSRLYYCALENPEDWSGAGSGFIDISKDDGDKITGLASHKDELWIFKGPYRGSIHRIAGSAPTGTDSFRRKTFVKGLGSGGHNSIFPYRNDLAFMSPDGLVYSLASVERFGDFEAAALSAPINDWLRTNVITSRLNQAWAISNATEGVALFTLCTAAATTPNTILMMDYRFPTPRWSYWSSFTATSLAIGTDPNSSDKLIVYAGGDDGFLKRMFRVSRQLDDGSGIAMRVETPYVDYGFAPNMKTLSAIGVFVTPSGNTDILVDWTRDSNATQMDEISQSGGGFLLGTSILGTGVLGGSDALWRFAELPEGGEFHAISYNISHTEPEDAHVHLFGTAIELDDWSTENL